MTQFQITWVLEFIKTGLENPRPVDGDERCVCQRQKTANQMLKQVQHDNRIGFSSFCHPELGSGSRLWGLKPRPVGGVLYSEERGRRMPTVPFSRMRERL